MKKRQCYRCKRYFPTRQLVEWLEDCGELSPRFCLLCYYWILDHWEEGQDVTEFEAGADTDSDEEA
jgi:hypothetical protein